MGERLGGDDFEGEAESLAATEALAVADGDRD